MESFVDGTPSEATRCYLQCDRYWHANDPSRRPFFTCKPDSHNTASYQGHVECLPDPCPDWACKNNGTVVGGNMAVGCQCRCAQGWIGDDCSVHQAPARSCPDCFNGGTSVREVAGGSCRCSCTPGWVGVRCGISRHDQVKRRVAHGFGALTFFFFGLVCTPFLGYIYVVRNPNSLLVEHVVRFLRRIQSRLLVGEPFVASRPVASRPVASRPVAPDGTELSACT